MQMRFWSLLLFPGMVRPKTRTALKENQQLPWPRTNTEKLLWEMFEGSAAQFLAVLETLNDPTRRILISSPPAGEADVEVLDLYSELFMAAMYIMLGGGGNKTVDPETVSTSGVVKGRSHDGMDVSQPSCLVLLAYMRIFMLL